MYRNGHCNYRRRIIENDYHTDCLNKCQKSRQKGNIKKLVSDLLKWKLFQSDRIVDLERIYLRR